MKTVQELAREAGFVVSDVFGPLVDGRPVSDKLEAFANLVLEEAAKACDELAELNRKAMTDSMWQQEECASAIRSMKGQK